MNEQLVVKNFGPIKDATVDFKRVTVFIGPTGGGKSTLAKLAAVFRDGTFYALQTPEERISHFEYFGFKGYFKPEAHFIWIDSDKTFEADEQLNSVANFGALNNRIDEIYGNKKYSKLQVSLADILFSHLMHQKREDRDRSSDRELAGRLFQLHPKASLKALEIVSEISNAYRQSIPTYVPSERGFSAAIEYSIAGLVRDDIGLPKVLLDFTNSYSNARREVSQLDISFLNVKYIHRDGKDLIQSADEKELLNLYQAASGVQAVTPLVVLLEHLCSEPGRQQSFIIEEPELNLYPTAQQGLLNWLVEKCTKGENDLTITTHSPYLLAHFNLLLYAYQVAENHPDRADDVAKIVPRESWINPKEFAAYHVEGQQENGVRSIVNPETGLISYNGLDATANAETSEFEKLMDINAGLEVE